MMKAKLLALFVALLMVGCGEESQSVEAGGDVEDKPFLPSLPSFNLNESEFERTKRQAEGGDKVAQNNLGKMYYNGIGVPKDYKEAVNWYRKAAQHGEANSQFKLALMYDNGRGVPEDDKEAVKWYIKAAEQGYAVAQFNLGVMYDDGEGVPQDYKEAVKWYTKAAEQGYAVAQYNLGWMYHKGEGVPKDLIPAYAWFNVAQANGDEEGWDAGFTNRAKKCRDGLKLNAKELAEATALSTEIYKRIEANGKN
jgi:TPR repeat protein